MSHLGFCERGRRERVTYNSNPSTWYIISREASNTSSTNSLSGLTPTFFQDHNRLNMKTLYETTLK